MGDIFNNLVQIYAKNRVKLTTKNQMNMTKVLSIDQKLGQQIKILINTSNIGPKDQNLDYQIKSYISISKVRSAD